MKGVIFIGIQATGKSTFYLSKLYNTHIRLNMDMLKTRHRENLLLEACLDSKQPVVIDNTNPTKLERKKYIDNFKNNKFEVIGYYFSSKLEDSLKRNSSRTGKEKIPEIGIRGTYNRLEIPSLEEGFDRLYFVTIENNEFAIEEWVDEV